MAGPHHRGSHQARARRIVAAANANPDTRCWRPGCGRTLAEHPPHHDGTPARWTAGHTIDSLIDGPLAPEASTCNYAAGARHGNALRTARRNPRSETL